MFKLFFKKTNQKGFTLIELLVVIAIIGILSTVVIVGLSSSSNRAKRASAIATASSIMPELVTCADDGGFGLTTVAPTTAVYICCNAASGAVANCDDSGEARPGHTVKWPDINTKTGWSWVAPTGTLANSDYTFTATKSGETTITCTISNNSCQ